LDAALHAPARPDVPVALTLNVYEVPFVRPLTVMGEDDPVPVIQPGVDVAVYPVIPAGMPVQAGAVNATEAVVSPPVAVPIVGAPGGVGHNP
jgi:hypothetical protein